MSNEKIIAIAKDGTPITVDLAEQLAREAEHGYELSKGRPVGRRSLAGGAGKSPRLNFRVTPDLWKQVAERAEREGKTPSELAREALERYVAT